MHFIDLHVAADLESAFERAATLHPDLVFDVQNPLLLATRKRYADLALQYHLPTSSGQREYVEAGHLIAYSLTTLRALGLTVPAAVLPSVTEWLE